MINLSSALQMVSLQWSPLLRAKHTRHYTTRTQMKRWYIVSHPTTKPFFKRRRFQIPIFNKETDGSPRKQKFIMGRRNWCSVDWDPLSGDLIFDIRVEKEKGCGETVGYIFFPSRLPVSNVTDMILPGIP
jgi:hypothetical protein